MRSVLRTAALALSVSLAFALPANAEVQLSLRNGRVTLVAKDATVRQILTEWARVGKMKIVNVERIPGGPLTLEFKDVPEADVLNILLRSLSGYIAAPRATLAAPDASVYDSIAVLPTVASAAPRTPAASGAPAPFSPPPTFTQNDDDQDNNNQPRPAGAQQQPNARPPIFSTFPAPQGNGNANAPRPVLPVVRPGVTPQPREQQPQPNTNVNEPPVPIAPPQAPPPAAPTGAPGGLVGVSAPGMLPPAASQPGQQTR